MGSHYFDQTPVVRSEPGRVVLSLPDLTLRLATDRGVFSPDRVDPGSKLLLQVAPPPEPGHVVVDVGSGYGPIAIALAVRQPAAEVWAVEVNERARDLCRINALSARCTMPRIADPSDVPAGLVVDRIYSNPPIKVGKALLHELLEMWLARLRPETGVAYLVVHKHLGSDSLARWLEESGHRTKRLVSRQGYRVLEVLAPEASAE